MSHRSQNPEARRGGTFTPLALVSAVLFASIGCSSEDPGPAPSVSARIEPLAPISVRGRTDATEAEPPPSKITASLAPTSSSEPWVGTAPGGSETVMLDPRATGRTSGERVPATMLIGTGGERTLRMAIPESSGDFNECVLEMKSYGQAAEIVQLRFYADGELIATSRDIEPRKTTDHQVVIVPAPELRRTETRPDEMEVAFLNGRVRQIAVSQVSFAERSWLSFLPTADAPSVELVGDHYRESIGLELGTPLAFDIADTDGRTLEFAVGQPSAMADPSAAICLSVEVTGAGAEPIQETFTFPASETPRWEECQLDLSALGGGPAEAVFRLAAPPGRRSAELVLLETPAVAKRSEDAPTVILITSDTHRGDHLGLAGSRGLVVTPALDALGRSGVLFEQCYAQTNITTPSHAALMTGIHPKDTRIVSNRIQLSRRAQTLAEHYRSAGYATYSSLSTKSLLDPYSGLGQGFRRMGGPLVGIRDAGDSVAEIVQWIDESEGLPVFVWLHLFDAHDPYGPPAPFSGRYYDEDKDPRDTSREWSLSQDLTPHWLNGVTDVDFLYAEYRAEIDYLDSELRRLLELERVQSGIVAFTSDHGENFGDHGIWFSHGGLYPSTLHVPLMLRWPGGPSFVRSSAPVRQMDLGRTLLNLSDLQHVEFPGRDLRWGIDSAEAVEPRYFLSSHGSSAAIEMEGWLFILSLTNHQLLRSEDRKVVGMCELYDLRSDPTATDNLIQSELDRAKPLRAALLDWLQTTSSEGLNTASETSAEMESMLAELGYARAESEDSTHWWDPEARSPRWNDSRWKKAFDD